MSSRETETEISKIKNTLELHRQALDKLTTIVDIMSGYIEKHNATLEALGKASDGSLCEFLEEGEP